MICKIKGTLVSIEKKLPEGNDVFKPHQLLHLLQIEEGGKANVQKIKEEDYNKIYAAGKEIELPCAVSLYTNDRKQSYLTVKVIK